MIPTDPHIAYAKNGVLGIYIPSQEEWEFVKSYLDINYKIWRTGSYFRINKESHTAVDLELPLSLDNTKYTYLDLVQTYS